MRHLSLVVCALAAAWMACPWLATAAEGDEPRVDGKTASEWIKVLEDQGPSKEAYAALTRFDEEAIPVFLKALGSKGEAARNVAIEMLGRFGDKAKDAVPELMKLLKDKGDWVRQPAAYSLGRIGPAAKAALPILGEILTKDEEGNAREAAADAIAQIGTTAEMVPLPVKALADEEWGVRRSAAQALGVVGPGAKDAAPALVARLADENEYVVKFAGAALTKIGKNAVPALVKALEHKEWRVRDTAAKTLGAMGFEAKDAIEPLRKAAEKETVRGAKLAMEDAIASIERTPE